MKFKTVLILLLLATPAIAEEADQKSYYQHTPTQTLQPMTIWNPLLTTGKDGKTTRSYFQYPPSDVLKPGSLWNTLVTEKPKQGGR